MNQQLVHVLDKWLEIDFYVVANKAKFIPNTVSINDNLIFETIRCLDSVTSMQKNISKNYVITIVALMWEHIDKKKYDIRNFVLKILTRIGNPTSAIIIDDGFNEQSG